MMSVTNKPFMMNVIIPNTVMLSITYKPFMLSLDMARYVDVIMLSATNRPLMLSITNNS